DRHLLTVANGDQRADREADLHRVVGGGDLDFLAGLVDQLHRGTHVPGAARTATLRIDDDLGRQTGDLVDLLGNGHALFHVLELHGTRVLGDDRPRQRIPAGELHAGLDG